MGGLLKKRYFYLAQAYYREYSPVRSQIDSFNYFIEHEMQEIVNEIGEIKPVITPTGVKEVVIKLGRVGIGKPESIEHDGTRRIIYPLEARIRKLTYAAPVILDFSVYYDGSLKDKFSAEIGRLPIMVKSKYCNLYGLSEEEQIKIGEDPSDMGGYFIINGSERIIVMTEELLTNKLYVEREKSGAFYITGRLFSEAGLINSPHKFELGKDGIIYVSFGKIKRTPIIPVIKALGLTRDDEISREMSGEKMYDEILVNLMEYSSITSQEEAIKWLADYWKIPGQEELRKMRVYNILDKYLLPHIGQKPEDRIRKAINIVKYAKKILRVHHGEIEEDDRDHYMNKQVRLAGELMGEMFRNVLRILLNDMVYQYQRMVKRGRDPSIKAVIRPKIFTERFENVMGTGQWTRKRVGVSQLLDRYNKLASLSHLTRIRSPIDAEGEMIEARMLHGTHWGRVCPVETPEGKSTGLRKNLALLARITPGEVSGRVWDKLISIGLKPYLKDGY